MPTLSHFRLRRPAESFTVRFRSLAPLYGLSRIGDDTTRVCIRAYIKALGRSEVDCDIKGTKDRTVHGTNANELLNVTHLMRDQER